MDDFSAMLNSVMSSPEAMENIKNLLGSMANNLAPQEPAEKPGDDKAVNTPDIGALMQMLNPSPKPANNNGFDLSGINMDMIMKLAPLLGSLGGGQAGGTGGQSGGAGGLDLSKLGGLLGGGQSAESGGINLDMIMKLAPLLGSLGGGQSGGSGGQSGGGLDLSKLGNLLGGGQSANNSMINMDMMMKLMPVISTLNQEDEKTKLFRAIKPHLSEARRHRVDEAVQFLQIIRLIPLMKEFGIF